MRSPCLGSMFAVLSPFRGAVKLILIVLALVGSRANAQSSSMQLPKFEDYPINEIFRGTPRPPILTTPEQRRFRTRIRKASRKDGEFGSTATGAANKNGPDRTSLGTMW